jgi:tRNA(Ile)-lysidine synthase
MAPRIGIIVRPLIETGRAQIEDYLRSKQQAWRTDTTNFDLTFARNRLRHSVIPNLTSTFNPNLADTLSRTLEILDAEEAWMEQLTEDWWQKHGRKESSALLVNCKTLACEPPALVRRIVRAGLKRVGSSLRNVTFDHVESIRTLLEAGKSGKVIGIPGGFAVARSFDDLIFQPPTPAAAEFDYELKIPGDVHIPEVGKTFRAEIVDRGPFQATADRVFVDADTLGPRVRIRNWKPGDYYRPLGLPAGKLKKLFQRARIPRGQRRSWPVLVVGSTIIWVVSFPVSREFAPGRHSQKIVAFDTSSS